MYPRKISIALVVRRHRHDRPRAVLHQYIVGNPYFNRLSRQWVQGAGPAKNARLLVGGLALDSRALSSLLHIRFYRVVLRGTGNLH